MNVCTREPTQGLCAPAPDDLRDLNSEPFQEKVNDAIETCLYTFKLPVILNTDGTYTVFDEDDGTVFFRGSNWDMVRWVRDRETVLIEPDLDPGMGPAVREVPDIRELPKL